MKDEALKQADEIAKAYDAIGEEAENAENAETVDSEETFTKEDVNEMIQKALEERDAATDDDDYDSQEELFKGYEPMDYPEVTCPECDHNFPVAGLDGDGLLKAVDARLCNIHDMSLADDLTNEKVVKGLYATLKVCSDISERLGKIEKALGGETPAKDVDPVEKPEFNKETIVKGVMSAFAPQSTKVHDGNSEGEDSDYTPEDLRDTLNKAIEGGENITDQDYAYALSALGMGMNVVMQNPVISKAIKNYGKETK